MKKILLALAGVIASSMFYAASAQDDGPTPEEQAMAATADRQAVFKLLRVNIGAIIGMAQGAPFEAEVAERNARRIATIATMIPEVFNMDTRGYDVQTLALDVIWDDPEDFGDKAQALVAAANEFADVAAGGDMATTLGAVQQLGGTCGNCHDTYRQDVD